AGLRLRCNEGFVARPNLAGLAAEEWDERVADLQYRDCFEWAVGHGVATRAVAAEDGRCREVATTWVPTAEVEKVEPRAVAGVELSMEALAAMGSADEVRAGLGGLAEQYRAWIVAQRAGLPGGRRGEVAAELLGDAELAAQRIAEGLAALGDAQVLEAFRLANRVMAQAARQRTAQIKACKPEEADLPRWRPFQVAFLLMNLPGIADPREKHRPAVDLLFFPTGGGKTEAYLGLAAFTLVLRRLRNSGVSSAGVSVLMRYTLRLLTLDQLSRAATLVCALELERQKDVARLGPWPFEIGLWVGQAATPNKMGEKGDNNPESARAKTLAFKNNDRKPMPIPIENCPWCGTRFTTNSFRLEPNPDRPRDLVISCANRACAFTGGRALPIVAVDEPLYRRLPCFVIATVDKFASLPWVGQVGALFGRVQRHDKHGFYGPSDPGLGSPLERPLLPPDLIIQDELHLISGPLGTVAGLYEAAIEALCIRDDGSARVAPKIVASTATVRRASQQIRALFGRTDTRVFPPPGPDRRDSFFAVTVPRDEKNARLYVGLAAPGRSPKVLLLRSYLPLLGAAQRLWAAEGGKSNKDNPADPYMTLVGYFNALRELGGSRRIVEDEVTVRVAAYGARKRVGETAGLFSDRELKMDLVELTSREPTSAVANAKRRLGLPFTSAEHVDVALATNMISVGLDITRLGLMVVLGQPKATAEYIQATSRVGRDDERPGLVVTLLNIHRPRDRSHYERFEAYHASFYRAVEVTSVTPFAPRAIDRSLAAVAVALARQGHAPLNPPLAAVDVVAQRAQLAFVADAIVRRSQQHASLSKEEETALSARLRQRVADILDDWSQLASARKAVGATFQYQEHEATGPFLLRDPLDPTLDGASKRERQFRAHRSMRDVEPSAPLWVKRLDGTAVAEEV
ncbi:MAG: DISARM system helicase DrmA, partial [Solirubrobacteraceae bacterium]|nr:DISARM system helicase DrmA [Solirubrobacteraceae bacterium]